MTEDKATIDKPIERPLNESINPDLYQTYTANELRSLELEAPKEIVPNMIMEGLNILAGTPKCLHEDTDILTPQGPIAINDIEVGQQVYGYNEDGSISLTSVLEKHDTGIKKVYSFTHRGRHVVSATAEHKWLSVDKRGKVKERDGIGASVKNTKIKRVFIEAPLGNYSEPKAYAIGALLGDGCMLQSSQSSIYISSGNEEVPKKVQAVLNAKYCYPQHEANYTYRISNFTGKGNNSKSNNLDLGDVADLLKLSSSTKDFSIEKLKTYNRASLKEFLAGLIDTDGSIQQNTNKAGKTLKISFSSTNPKLINLFCWAVYRLYQIKPVSSPNYRKDASKFELSARVSNTLDSRRILKDLQGNLVSPRAEYKSEYDDLNAWSKSDEYAVTISEEYKLEQTYDITIGNKTNLYVLANQGLITHNSGKSLLLIKLASMIATGGTYLDIKLEKRRVLYLGLEDTLYRLRNRMRGLKCPFSDDLVFSTSFPKMESEEGLEYLNKHIHEDEFSLVIIDTLGRFSTSGNQGGNAYDTDTLKGEALQKIGFSGNAGILLVHHMTKGAKSNADFVQSISGTQGMPGAADVILGFMRKRNTDISQLHITGRDVKAKILELEWNTPKGGWQLAIDEDKEGISYADSNYL